MKKSLKFLLAIAVLLLACTLLFTACGDLPAQSSGNTDTTTEPEGHTHKFSEWTTVKKATCTEKGEKERSCTCGEKETEALDPLGHTEVVDKAVAPTCTDTGASEGKHCSTCGKIIVASQELPIVAHTYDDQYDDECNVCGHRRNTECGHKETETLKGKAPTCTSTGLTEGTRCKKCNEILVSQTVIPVSDHTEVIDKAVAPTCTATGLTEGKHCSVCSATIVAQTTVKAKGHTEVVDKAVAPTCTQAGLTEGKHCSVCFQTCTEQTVIDALGHDHRPDLSAGGCAGKNATFNCSRCSDSYSKKLEPISLDFEIKYWSYYDTQRFVQDVIAFQGITGGSGEYTVTLTYTNLFGETFEDVYANVSTLYERNYLGNCSWATPVFNNLKSYATIVVTDTFGLSTTYEIKFPCLPSYPYLDNVNSYDAYVTFDISTYSTLHPNTAYDTGYLPTCSNTGLTDGSHCADCGEVLVPQQTVPKDPARHTYEESITAPSCRQPGITTMNCSRCGDSFSRVWDPITFDFDFGYYYLNQGGETVYYVEIEISNITGGCAIFSQKERLSNQYTVNILNTANQERKTFYYVNEGTQTLTARYYSNVYDSSFRISINDAYSTYVYSVAPKSNDPVLVDTPAEHHSWDAYYCGYNATCSHCGKTETVPHVDRDGRCIYCNSTTYYPKFTLPNLPVMLSNGQIECVSIVAQPYTANDYFVDLTFTFYGFKSNNFSLMGYRIFIYNSQGILADSRIVTNGSEVPTGDYKYTLKLSVLASSSYTIIIESFN